MKKKHLLIIAIFVTIAVLVSCRNGGSSPFAGEETFDRDASYALGMMTGAEFMESMIGGGIIPNIDEFLNGIRDTMTGRNTRFDMFEAIGILDTAFVSLIEERTAEARQTEISFLAENARNPGVVITSSGLQYEVITEGAGPKPSATDIVQVHYEGAFIDGTVFDSSYARGFPAEFMLNQVIPGWTEGLQLMSPGSHYRFTIPSNLGYGPGGSGPIPPYSTLVFYVELLGILN